METIMCTLRWLTPLAFLLVLASCGGTRRAPADPQEATYVRVENQSTLDMNIYVLRSGQRVRLGTATAHQTSRFRIPRDLIFGITPLRFMADPIGGNRTPVTQEIAVTAGDEIVLTIPPGSI
jgi:hypothetical protein